jgi:hypothetical protein
MIIHHNFSEKEPEKTLARFLMILKFQFSFSVTATSDLRTRARTYYKVRVDWSTGLEIIAIFFTFISLILYSAFVFKFGRSP